MDAEEGVEEKFAGSQRLLARAPPAFRPQKKVGGSLASFEKPLIRLARHPSEAVVVAACELLRFTKSPRARAVLRDPKTLRRGARVRFAALHSLGKLEGAKLTPFLLELGEDADFLAPVLQTLKEVGDNRATPFLEKVIRSHKRDGIKNRAQRALDAIERRGQR